MAHNMPDGMGQDRHNERQNMREAAHAEAMEDNWAVVSYSRFDVYRDGFDSKEEAEAWLDDLPDPDDQLAPEWYARDPDDVTVANIGK